jgi:hypothetical protein
MLVGYDVGAWVHSRLNRYGVGDANVIRPIPEVIAKVIERRFALDHKVEIWVKPTGAASESIWATSAPHGFVSFELMDWQEIAVARSLTDLRPMK